MSKPLPNTLLIDDDALSFHVEFSYENLPLFCSRCKITGHSPDKCHKKVPGEGAGFKGNLMDNQDVQGRKKDGTDVVRLEQPSVQATNKHWQPVSEVLGKARENSEGGLNKEEHANGDETRQQQLPHSPVRLDPGRRISQQNPDRRLDSGVSSTREAQARTMGDEMLLLQRPHSPAHSDPGRPSSPLFRQHVSTRRSLPPNLVQGRLSPITGNRFEILSSTNDEDYKLPEQQQFSSKGTIPLDYNHDKIETSEVRMNYGPDLLASCLLPVENSIYDQVTLEEVSDEDSNCEENLEVMDGVGDTQKQIDQEEIASENAMKAQRLEQTLAIAKAPMPVEEPTVKRGRGRPTKQEQAARATEKAAQHTEDSIKNRLRGSGASGVKSSEVVTIGQVPTNFLEKVNAAQARGVALQNFVVSNSSSKAAKVMSGVSTQKWGDMIDED